MTEDKFKDTVPNLRASAGVLYEALSRLLHCVECEIELKKSIARHMQNTREDATFGEALYKSCMAEINKVQANIDYARAALNMAEGVNSDIPE